MVRKIRISIARLMGVVLVAAIGFAALRNASVNWAGLMLMLTCGVLMLGVVGAVCRGPHERAWWLGFTLFGGGYLVLAHAMAFSPDAAADDHAGGIHRLGPGRETRFLDSQRGRWVGFARADLSDPALPVGARAGPLGVHPGRAARRRPGRRRAGTH